MIVDYNYYENIFAGDKIPADIFERMSARAESELNKLILYKNYSNYRGVDYTEQVKLAICSIADVLYEVYQRDKILSNLLDGKTKIVSSEKIGDYSRNFENLTPKELMEQNSTGVISRKIYEEASIYLLSTGLLNRGVYIV